MRRIFTCIGLILILSFSVLAQTKKKNTSKKPVKKTPKPAVVNTNVSKTGDEAASTIVPPKKNERPEESPAIPQDAEPKKNNRDESENANSKPQKTKMPYIYEFSQPDFVISRVVIEHDESGKGTISFEKKEFSGEAISDPLNLSPTTLGKINKYFDALNFLNSSENYQTERDYSHLGNHTITLRKNGQERTAKYNWTENKDAKGLVEEYRKVGEQFIWYFEMNISRENQPLEAPGLVDKLNSLIRRNEISDPAQMLPYLKDLSNDERIPLLARNKTTKLIKEIEKKK